MSNFRSLHDHRNKTQSMFRGWDFSEITEWLEVNKEKSGKFKHILYRIRLWKKIVWNTTKELFLPFIYDYEEVKNIETKKALDFLIKKVEDVETGHSAVLDVKYREKINGLRTYIIRLAEQDSTYVTPLWQGLSRIEHDAVFLTYVKYLLETLWD